MHNGWPIRLLIIFALLFAQMGGLTHSISHVLSEQSQSGDQSPPHDKHCDLCDAYAHVASAIGSDNISFVGSANYETLHFNRPGSYIFNTFVAFAARAPPYSV
ncbi:MAG: hypothetical protein Q7K57_57080 [Burkholderiaceae bacterium]|nr:hypothetical protein [Burkholderiaceae bacterium]